MAEQPSTAAQPPATTDDHGPIVDTIHDLHADHRDPQHQVVQQNLGVALLPLALIAIGILMFVAAGWTILVAAQ